MNNYPEWWDTAITIYNRFEDSQTQIIRWYKTTLNPECFWKYVGDKITVGQTILETNNIICRIPINELFKEKYEWEQLPNDSKGQYFTLGQGDIIVKGTVTDTVDEYTAGKRSSDLLAKYKALQGCMEIQQVAINIGAGRCNEHYYVRGI